MLSQPVFAVHHHQYIRILALRLQLKRHATPALECDFHICEEEGEQNGLMEEEEEEWNG